MPPDCTSTRGLPELVPPQPVPSTDPFPVGVFDLGDKGPSCTRSLHRTHTGKARLRGPAKHLDGSSYKGQEDKADSESLDLSQKEAPLLEAGASNLPTTGGWHS